MLNVTALCSPSILLTKPKFHFLVHLPAYIERFGPAILFSTERYESYNAVFRAASIFSNRMAPSRDIASCFANMDRVKHTVTGGWWKDIRTSKWTHASVSILRHVQDHPEHAKLIGLSSKEARTPGKRVFHCSQRVPTFNNCHCQGRVTMPPAGRSLLIEWTDSLAHKSAAMALPATLSLYKFRKAVHITATSLDNLACGQNAIVRSEGVST